MKKSKYIKMYFIISVIFLGMSIFATNMLLSDNVAAGSIYNKVNFSFNSIFILLFFLFYYLIQERTIYAENRSYLYFVFFYLTLFYLPLISYASVIRINTEFLVYSALFVSVLVIFGLTKPLKITIKAQQKYVSIIRKSIEQNRTFYWAVLILTILAILTMTWYFTGFELSLNLDGVYRARALYKEKTNFYLNVLKNTFGWYIVPVLLMNELKYKRIVTSLLMLAMGILLFTWGKDKIFIFLFFMVFVLQFIKDINIYKLSYMLLLGMVAGLILSFLLYALQNSNFFYTVVMRRLFITPQDVSNKYFEFFSVNPKLYWTQDVFLIDKLFTPVYDQSYFKLISASAYDNLVENPCTGALGESFAQWGWFGLILYPSIIKGLLSILNGCMSNFDDRTRLLVVFNFSFLIIDSGMTTSDFMMEFILSCILLWGLNKRWSIRR